jgi:hypothetical protein
VDYYFLSTKTLVTAERRKDNLFLFFHVFLKNNLLNSRISVIYNFYEQIVNNLTEEKFWE